MTQDELQEDIINKAIKFYSDNDKGYLNLAMRAGKTRITIEILKRMYEEGGLSILVAYPDNKLKQTWEEECLKWDYNYQWIRYTNFSSLKKCNDQDYDVIICDEFHALSPNEENLLKELNASMWLFLSGTVKPETKEKWPDFKEIANYTTLDGIRDGILADYTITVHLVQLDDKIQTKNKRGKLVTEKKQYDNYSYVISQMQRGGQNSMFLALSRNRLSLSSIGKMSYLKALLNKLKDKRVLVFTGLAAVADSIGIPSYHSKSPSNSGYLNFHAEKSNHLALAAMGKVGVTYPNLDSVILMNFTYNAEESAQILNRAIKLDYKGKIADLHILCLSEPPELKKIKESLSMLDQNKIKYL